MGTRFEVVGHGTTESGFQAAAEEAFEEIRRMEDLHSLYRETSDVGRLNRSAGKPDWVRIHPLTMRLLERAKALSASTEAAFDPTAGALVRVWGFHGADGRKPSPVDLEEARSRVGWELLELDSGSVTARWIRPGCLLDLGAVAKGHALDRAAELLLEAGLGNFLLHGGTSSIIGRGRTPEGSSWKVALPTVSEDGSPGGGRVVVLDDRSLSYSAAWGRSFVEDGRRHGHVLDPRSGHPVRAHVAAAVVGPSAEMTDALSTALMVAGEALGKDFGTRFPGYEVLSLEPASAPE